MSTDGGSTSKPVLSTMWSDEDDAWNAEVDVLPYRPLDLADVRRFWQECDRHRGVVLIGSVPARARYRDLILAMSLKLRRRRPHVLISDATWEPRSRALEARLPMLSRIVPRMSRVAIRLIDGPHVTYGVLSHDEVQVFSEQWGIPRDRVKATSFCHTLIDGQDQIPTLRGDYLFAGGNSLRDYGVLLQALDAAGGMPTRVAAHWGPPDDRARDWLHTGPTSHDEFIELMASCRACVTPLAPSIRSAGQQTYLNAMLLRKPVVVTEAPGVHELVEHGVTGLVVPPRADALAEALQFVMSDAHIEETTAMGERAREWVLANATPHLYRARLVDIALGRG